MQLLDPDTRKTKNARIKTRKNNERTQSNPKARNKAMNTATIFALTKTLQAPEKLRENAER